MMPGDENCGRCAAKVACSPKAQPTSVKCNNLRDRKRLPRILEDVPADPAPEGPSLPVSPHDAAAKLYCKNCPALPECGDDIKPLSSTCSGKRNAWGLSTILTSRPEPPIPSLREAPKHVHTYQPLSVLYRDRTDQRNGYERIDEFYCTECLAIEIKKRESYDTTPPDWWKS